MDLRPQTLPIDKVGSSVRFRSTPPACGTLRGSIMENVIVIDEAIVRAMVEARDAGPTFEQFMAMVNVAHEQYAILPSWVLRHPVERVFLCNAPPSGEWQQTPSSERDLCSAAGDRPCGPCLYSWERDAQAPRVRPHQTVAAATPDTSPANIFTRSSR